ncbi:MAG: glutathione S-transferase family protein [Rhodospirillales bacterium]|nr:glutathione S-transferase family protein [Rhodospirillales bacterium]
MADQDDLILYHISPSRSSIVLWMLEEIGQPYALRVLNMSRGENREPAYLSVNPMGKVPALVHHGAVITETAAICCYLAETFSAAGLEVPAGDPRRGAYLKWMFFMNSCLEPALLDRMLKRTDTPRQASGYGDFETLLSVLTGAIEPGPFLLGEAFSAPDVLIGSSLRWGRMIDAIPDRPEIAAYIARLEARPACRRAMERDRALATPAEPVA